MSYEKKYCSRHKYMDFYVDGLTDNGVWKALSPIMIRHKPWLILPLVIAGHYMHKRFKTTSYINGHSAG